MGGEKGDGNKIRGRRRRRGCQERYTRHQFGEIVRQVGTERETRTRRWQGGSYVLARLDKFDNGGLPNALVVDDVGRVLGVKLACLLEVVRSLLEAPQRLGVARGSGSAR